MRFTSTIREHKWMAIVAQLRKTHIDTTFDKACAWKLEVAFVDDGERQLVLTASVDDGSKLNLTSPISSLLFSGLENTLRCSANFDMLSSS